MCGEPQEIHITQVSNTAMKLSRDSIGNISLIIVIDRGKAKTTTKVMIIEPMLRYTNREISIEENTIPIPLLKIIEYRIITVINNMQITSDH